MNKKTINEKYEPKKQFEQEFEEFRKITESLIRGAERLGLLDNEKIIEHQSKQQSWNKFSLDLSI